MKKVRLPHEDSYTRIGVSKIHGVGVFAIKNIPTGIPIFKGDDSEIVWILRTDIKNQPESIKKLYDDFCIVKGDLYGCPQSFNQMTIGWYLNHSDNPNVVSDSQYEFFAIRDISVGEELTIDYKTFSDY